jgi:hypothetical protein
MLQMFLGKQLTGFKDNLYGFIKADNVICYRKINIIPD